MAFLTDEELAILDPESVANDGDCAACVEEREKDTFLIDLLRRDCEELLDVVEQITRISGNIKFYNTTRQQIQAMTMILKRM